MRTKCSSLSVHPKTEVVTEIIVVGHPGIFFKKLNRKEILFSRVFFKVTFFFVLVVLN